MDKALIIKLNEKDIHRYGLEFYGIEDLSTGWTIKNIFEDMKKIQIYYSKFFNGKINNFNDYLNLLFLDYLIEFKECPSNFKRDTDKLIFKDFIEELENIKKKVNIGSLCKFIISEYKYLFQEYDQKYIKHPLRKKTIKIMANYKLLSSNEDITIYLIKNSFYFIFDNLDILSPQLKQNKKLLKSIYLEDGNFNQLYKNRLDTLLLHTSNVEFKVELLDKLYKKITLEIEEYKRENTESKGLKLLIELPKLYEVFYKNKCKFISEFTIEKKSIEDNINNFLTESGFYKPISYTSSNEAYKKFLEKNSKVENKILFNTISHNFIENNGWEKKNKLELISQNYRFGLMDIVATPKKTNTFYTTGKIMLIEENLKQYAINLLTWTDDSYQMDFFSTIEVILKDIHNFLDIGFIEEEIKNDIRRIKTSINDILDIKKENHSYYCQNAIFIFVSSFEKMIRTFIYKLNENNFYKNEKAALKALLKSEKLGTLIGEDTIKWIIYYFLQEDSIGENYRNKICHYKNKLDEYNLIDAMKVLWLIVASLNSILINLADEGE